MEIQIGSITYTLELPDHCPCCNKGTRIDIVAKAANEAKNELGLILHCSRCEQFHFLTYATLARGLGHRTTSLQDVFPPPMPDVRIPIEMEELYPDFCKIYKQTAYAEIQGLDHIVGVGYRKALEYLVKHYLSEQLPDERDAILSEPLGKSIKRIPHAQMQNLAKASTWIGNDQTHIIQKHPNHSVPEMKRFILAFCHLIVFDKIDSDASTFLSQD